MLFDLSHHFLTVYSCVDELGFETEVLELIYTIIKQ